VLLATGAAPRALEPARIIKLADADDGRYQDVFALYPGGARLAAVRKDGAGHVRLETIELATGAVVKSRDLPAAAGALERLELPPAGPSVVALVRDGDGREAPLSALLIDGAGRVAERVGPATAFGRPHAPHRRGRAAGSLLLAVNRVISGPADAPETTYTITPYHLETLAQAGPPSSPWPSPDGGAIDPATAELWAEGRTALAALNQDDKGVDVVDQMGNRQPALLAVPFRLYDPRSLRDLEGPAGELYFGIAVDPVNPDALRRRKPDLPMLDLYAAPAPVGRTQAPARLCARVFAPRPVTWRAGYGKLVVLKRSKPAAREGDELQVYDLTAAGCRG
jgi:hypothetical protein